MAMGLRILLNQEQAQTHATVRTEQSPLLNIISRLGVFDVEVEFRAVAQKNPKRYAKKKWRR